MKMIKAKAPLIFCSTELGGLFCPCQVLVLTGESAAAWPVLSIVTSRLGQGSPQILCLWILINKKKYNK